MRLLFGLFATICTSLAGAQAAPRPSIIAAILGKNPATELAKFDRTELNTPIPGWGWTPIVYAVAHDRHEAFDYLLKSGASVNPYVGKGKSLLHLAARFRDWKVIQPLLDNKLDPYPKDAEGKSAVDYVIGGHSFNHDWPTEPLTDMIPNLEKNHLRTTAAQREMIVNVLVFENWEFGGENFDLTTRSGRSREERLLWKPLEKFWAKGIHEPGDTNPETEAFVLRRAARHGDLRLLKLAISHTPQWQKLAVDPYESANWGVTSLTDHAYWCHNHHIVRFLMRNGLPSPSNAFRAKMRELGYEGY